MKNSAFLSLNQLEATLKETVFGRDRQIALLCTLWSQTQLRLDGGGIPAIVLCGPGASGKKHLAFALAAALGKKTAALDLQRFADAEEFTGDNSPLIRLLQKNPDAVIVLEGIEKSAETIQIALTSLLEDARFLTQARNSLFFITTQAGEAFYRDPDFMNRFYEQPLYGQGIFMEYLGTATGGKLHPALLSRLALLPLVLFDPPKLQTLFEIARQSIEGMRSPFEQQSAMKLSFEKPFELAALLTLSLSPWLNALRLKERLPGHLLEPLLQTIRALGRAPRDVVIRVAPKPAKLLKECLTQPENWAWRLTRGNETVHLNWRYRLVDERLTLTLSEAKIAPRPMMPVWEGALRVRHPDQGFNAIPGQKNAKKALGEILSLLKTPERLARFGAIMPKGLLLFGPQGVGKAALARAFAAEAGWPCLEASGAALFDEAFLERLYEKAAAYAPAVILMEGLDAKGVVQGLVTTVPSEWLIERLDQAAKGVFTIATAEQIDEVPEILRTPGRLDLFLEVPELDQEARKAFLSKLLERPHEAGIDLDRLARMTGGLSGTDLQKIERGCTLEAAKRDLTELTQEMLIEQINTLKYGRKLEGVHLKNFERELQMTAWHEAGHAVLSSVLQPDQAIEQVTVAPRSGALGFVAYEVDEKLSNVTREEAMNTLCILMGGRLAQKKAFGENALDSGATEDLENATRLAWLAVSTLGLDEELGFMSLGGLSRDLGYMPFASRVEERVKTWLQRAEEQAKMLLEEHWSLVETLAKRLISDEVIEGDELLRLLGKNPKPAPAPQNPQKTGGSADR